MCTCHPGDSSRCAIPLHQLIKRWRCWCWRKRGKQWEFRREKNSNLNWMSFQKSKLPFFIWCSQGAFCGSVPLLLWKGNFVEVVWRHTEREGWVSASDYTAGARLSSSHWNRAGLQPDVPVSAVESQLQLQLRILPSESKATWSGMWQTVTLQFNDVFLMGNKRVKYRHFWWKLGESCFFLFEVIKQYIYCVNSTV